MKKYYLIAAFACLTGTVCSQNHNIHIDTKNGEKTFSTKEIRRITFEARKNDIPQKQTGTLSEKLSEYPAEYNEETENRGKVVRMKYETKAYDTGTKVTKYALVYLPYGYDPEDIKRYNVFYMMHGRGDRVDTYLKAPGGTSELKRALDHMIEDGEIEPLIVVTPTFYLPDRYGDNELNKATANFPKELTEDLMPTVARNYRTFATGTDKETFEATRSHRAFGGFSAGAATNWNVFAENIKYFREFIPMSGAMNLMGGSSTEDVATYLADIVRKSGYGSQDFYINAMTGTADFARSGLAAQVEAMGKQKEFTVSADRSKGNIYYRELEGGEHDYAATIVYIYNALLNMFK